MGHREEKIAGEDDGASRHIESLSFSSDNQLLASASADTTIKIWNLEHYSLKATIKGHTAYPYSGSGTSTEPSGC